jgi:nucleoside-diphosphate-sugar epimerase
MGENYILSKEIPEGKSIYILRPCMIHGPGNKGNLNLLYKWVSKGFPWPLGLFDNKRSFCSIENLLFVIKELITRNDIPSGIYNVADDDPISTNMLVTLIARSKNSDVKVYNVCPRIIYALIKLGDVINLPINTERFIKLTENYIVSNQKLSKAIGKEFPIKAIDGMLKTLNSFK